MNTDPPVPEPKISVFAVWRWPRWAWVLAIPVTLIVYLLLPEPVYYLLLKSDISAYSTFAHDAIAAVVEPAALCGQYVEFIGAIHRWEEYRLWEPERARKQQAEKEREREFLERRARERQQEAAHEDTKN